MLSNNERILEVPTTSLAFQTDNFTIDFKYHTDIDISVLIMTKKYLDDTYNNTKITLIMDILHI